MSCHLIPTWHEWNANTNDIMMTWFTLYLNPSDLCQACATCACKHGAHALTNMGVSNYSSGLACVQADPNLAKTTISHFWVLNSQNGNRNMPNMILIAYLQEILTNCNENLAWGKSEPLIHSYMFWYKTKR